MIPSYPAIKPQTIIRQLLDQLDSGVSLDKAEHIAGSAYQLQRYTNPTEYADMPSHAVTSALLSAGATLPFAGQESNSAVDHSFTRLYGEQVYGALASFTEDYRMESLENPANIVVQTGDFDSNLPADFRGLAPSTGTQVRITHGGKTYERSVVSVLPALTTSSYGSNGAATDGFAASGPNNPSPAAASALSVISTPAGMSLAVADTDAWAAWDKGTKVEGAYGERYTLTALADTVGGSTTFAVTSLSGQFVGEAVFTYSAPNHSSSNDLFGGLTVTISGAATISAGDIYQFDITGAYEVDLTAVTNTDRGLEITGAYTGTKDTTYTITVVEANENGAVTGAKVEIRDSAGTDITSVVTLTAGTAFSLGAEGLSGTFRDVGITGLLLGAVFTVKAVAAVRSGAKKVLVLNGPAVDTTGWTDVDTALTTVQFLTVYSGAISAQQVPPTPAFSSTDDGLVINPGLRVPVPGRSAGYEWVPVIADPRSKLFVHYRARKLPTEAGEVIQITSLADIHNHLGTVSADNPLAFAAYAGFYGSQERPIYVTKVSAETPDAYVAAFTQTYYRSELFILITATSDDAIQKAVQGVVSANSTAAARRFKHAYFSVETPEYSPIATRDADGSNLLATVESGTGGATRIVFQNENLNLASFNVRKGHELRINYASDVWGNDTYSTATIGAVLSATELQLEAPLASGLNAVPVKVEVHAPPTAEFQADAIAAFAASYANRRTPVVWSDKPKFNTASGEQALPTYAVAAYLGGLRSVLLPQMGLTDREVPIVSSVPGMYARFSTEQQDRIAAAGTMIVTQDSPRSPVYVRHQLTTETDKGPLYYEDSIGYNMDEISFALDTIPSKYRGKYQASDDLIRQIRLEGRSILTARTRAPLDNPLVGPQLAEFRDYDVFIHPTLRSKIVMTATLVFFLPFNQMEIQLRGTIDLEETELVTLETSL